MDFEKKYEEPQLIEINSLSVDDPGFPPAESGVSGFNGDSNDPGGLE